MTESTHFRVTISDHPYSNRLAIGLQLALKEAHGKNVSFCLCQKTPIRLVVKRYANGAKVPVFGLARWPDTGYDHHPDCHFFGDDSSSIPTTSALPAIEDHDNGMSRIYLETCLRIIDKNVQAIAAKRESASRASQKRNRASDLTLLLKLWRSAGLNISRSGGRKWFQVSFHLLKAATKCQINHEGETLDEFLLLTGGEHDRLANEHNQAVLSKASEKYSRLYVIGTLKTFTREKHRQMLRLYGQAALPPISVTLDLIDQLLDTPLYQSAMLSEQSQIIVIACIEPGNNGWWNTLSLQGIVTGPQYIPVETASELAFEAYLHEQGRKFIRPLNVDVSDSTSKPQYILLDTMPRTYCAVYDSVDSRTRALASEHQSSYTLRHQQFISWNSAESDAFPSLPEKDKTGPELS